MVASRVTVAFASRSGRAILSFLLFRLHLPFAALSIAMNSDGNGRVVLTRV